MIVIVLIIDTSYNLSGRGFTWIKKQITYLITGDCQKKKFS